MVNPLAHIDYLFNDPNESFRAVAEYYRNH